MSTHVEASSFYDFWSWQYKKRNPKILSLAKRVAEIVNIFYSSKLIKNKRPVRLASGDVIVDTSRFSPDYYEYIRTQTDEEQVLIDEARHSLNELGELAFCIDDILTLTPSPKTIINAIADNEDITKFTPESFVRFGTRSSISLGQHDKLFPTRKYGPTFFTFSIDISKTVRAIIPAVVREIVRIRALTPGSSFEDEIDHEQCKNWSEMVRRLNWLSEIELAADCSPDPKLPFHVEKSAPRAVGLWLWDYMQNTGAPDARGAQAAAILAIKRQLTSKLARLGYANSEERVFRSFIMKTTASIKAATVLSFK